MAFSVASRFWVLAVFLVCISVFCSYRGKADNDDEGRHRGGVIVDDPAQTVARALLCFNDKYLYSSCKESCRLTETGNLDVPYDYTDQYCNGPCMSETNLVLSCIDSILEEFRFYNKATVHDIRDTIHAGCGYGPGRGNFDVAEHIESEESSGSKIMISIGLMIIGRVLLI